MGRRSASMSGISLLLLLLPMFLTVNGDNSTSTSPSSADLQVLELINRYRTTVVNISTLSQNDGAFCVGRQVVQNFVNTACTNSTGAFAPYDEDQNIPDFQNILTNCHIALVNVTTGYIAVDCVPEGISLSNGPTAAAQNFTTARKYGVKINDTSFTSAGVASDGNWYALVLATNTSDGNYGTSSDLNENSAISGRVFGLPVIWTPIVVLLAYWFRVQDLWYY